MQGKGAPLPLQPIPKSNHNTKTKTKNNNKIKVVYTENLTDPCGGHRATGVPTAIATYAPLWKAPSATRSSL
jgi:hypothetical protein